MVFVPVMEIVMSVVSDEIPGRKPEIVSAVLLH